MCHGKTYFYIYTSADVTYLKRRWRVIDKKKKNLCKSCICNKRETPSECLPAASLSFRAEMNLSTSKLLAQTTAKLAAATDD